MALCIGFIVVLTVMNLRGVRESGTLFAIPTYGFLISVYVMLAVGLWRLLTGHAPVSYTHLDRRQPASTGSG